MFSFAKDLLGYFFWMGCLCVTPFRLFSYSPFRLGRGRPGHPAMQSKTSPTGLAGHVAVAIFICQGGWPCFLVCMPCSRALMGACTVQFFPLTVVVQCTEIGSRAYHNATHQKQEKHKSVLLHLQTPKKIPNEISGVSGLLHQEFPFLPMKPSPEIALRGLRVGSMALAERTALPNLFGVSQ